MKKWSVFICILFLAGWYAWFKFHFKAVHENVQWAEAAVLEGDFFEIPLGLPPIQWPEDNPYSHKKARLGQILYFDKRLSGDGTVSCATCHNIPCAYSDCRALAIGIKNQQGTRHSPTIINAAYLQHFFWDGRAASLEEQAKGPIANTKEMALVGDVHEAYRQCMERIEQISGYRPLFKEAFGNEEITVDKIAKAIATFERTVLSGNSPYDRALAGDVDAISEEQLTGFRVFKKAGCAHCHGGFNFTDDRFVNIGVGMDQPQPDLGRYAITHLEKDWGAFKTPTLRESEHTAPYMHDGAFKTLEEVVEFLDQGGGSNPTLSPLMHPLSLTADEKADLVMFLKALTGEPIKFSMPQLPK